MQRYKITLLVPHSREIIVADVQAAHNEATRLAKGTLEGEMAAIVHSIEYLSEVKTEEIVYD